MDNEAQQFSIFIIRTPFFLRCFSHKWTSQDIIYSTIEFLYLALLIWECGIIVFLTTDSLNTAVNFCWNLEYFPPIQIQTLFSYSCTTCSAVWWDIKHWNTPRSLVQLVLLEFSVYLSQGNHSRALFVAAKLKGTRYLYSNQNYFQETSSQCWIVLLLDVLRLDNHAHNMTPC